jgi:hypothetical protein
MKKGFYVHIPSADETTVSVTVNIKDLKTGLTSPLVLMGIDKTKVGESQLVQRGNAIEGTVLPAGSYWFYNKEDSDETSK